MKKILILHGPNLNLLGIREPDQYGVFTLEEINRDLETAANELEVSISCFQSNHEGVLIDQIQAAHQEHAAIVFNPGGFTHTSVALRDAISATSIPVVEVHISNIFAREIFRQTSIIAPVCAGSITGFGKLSYLLGLRASVELVNNK